MGEEIELNRYVDFFEFIKVFIALAKLVSLKEYKLAEQNQGVLV